MRWLGAVLFTILFVSSAPAASFQARLIRASNDKAPPEEQLKELHPKLKSVFGYEHYKQIGIQKQTLKEKETTTLNLGEGFVINVTPRSVENKKHKFEINLVSGKVSMVQATIEVGEKKTVFIKGPEVGSTLLIISLSVNE